MHYFEKLKKCCDNLQIPIASRINSKKTEDREYRPLESIADGYPKYLVTQRDLIQKRNGIKHVDIIDFILNQRMFD